MGRTEQGEQMPSEIAHAVYISGHERHDLRLARELGLLFLFVLLRTVGIVAGLHGWFGLVVGRRGRGGRGSDVLPYERLCEEDRVELDADAHLEDGGGKRPQLARHYRYTQLY